MKALKGIYENGHLILSEPAPEAGPVEVMVVFPDDTDDPWARIEAEPAPRAAFAQLMQECEDQIAQGKPESLDVNQL